MIAESPGHTYEVFDSLTANMVCCLDTISDRDWQWIRVDPDLVVFEVDASGTIVRRFWPDPEGMGPEAAAYMRAAAADWPTAREAERRLPSSF